MQRLNTERATLTQKVDDLEARRPLIALIAPIAPIALITLITLIALICHVAGAAE